jgi:energy-coupling factor transporter ATP-binding protein EcfA2
MKESSQKRNLDLSQSVIEYWKQSIKDSASMNVPESKLKKGYSISLREIKSGDITSIAINVEDEEVHDKTAEKGNKNEVLICPVVFKRVEDENDKKQEPNLITPIWIPACIEEGKLKPKKFALPWISREYLSPTYQNFTIGSLEDYIKFITNHKLSSDVDCWEKLWNFSSDLFFSVTKQHIEDYEINGYEKAENAIILQESNGQASNSLIKYYEMVIGTSKTPPLLNRYASPIKEERVPLQDDKLLLASKHLGQMSNEYPLSDSQRQTVHHFETLKEGEILAVNGPPGTGKTTLLQSIVANLWVEKAYKGDNPPIILISSTNNQAVTNVIDSMGNIQEITDVNDKEEFQEKLSVIKGRWLPNLTSYGLYCPSKSKLKELEKEKSPWLLLKDDGLGFHYDYENSELIGEKADFFLKKCNECSKVNLKSVQEAVDWLHGELKSTVDQLTIGIQQWDDFYQLKKELCAINIGEKEVESKLDSIQHSIENAEREIEHYDLLHKQSKKLISPWQKWFSFLPAVNKINKQRLEGFFAQKINGTHLASYDIDSVENWFLRKITELEVVVNDQLNQMKKIERYINLQEKIHAWCKEHGCDMDVKEGIKQLDKTLRFISFKWATHYWEGRWLLEAMEGTDDKKSVTKLKQKWYRYAMLTPCVVSTFFMSPKLFTAWQGEDIPLFNFLDLLIVDEAGQAGPEVAAPTFAFAKKALVVGDTLQIEPVWNIENKEFDKFNLQHYLHSKVNNKDELNELGISSSNGSVMMVAQFASKYAVDPAGGMFLSEHRRCVRQIIEFCNELAYGNKLIPMRDGSSSYPLPPIGYATIVGQTSAYRGSLYNLIEAEKIAEWIKKNEKTLIQHGNGKGLKDIIAVITPFSEQKKHIKKQLKKYEIKGLTVGTVHALQGAERDVVIFSPVYDKNYKKAYFFDKGINMLNVAVSRARDSFLVFGTTEIFKVEGDQPSNVLARFMYKKSNNKLTIDL